RHRRRARRGDERHQRRAAAVGGAAAHRHAVHAGESSQGAREGLTGPMFTVTKGRSLLTTTTGALPRPSWYTENLRGLPLSQGFSQLAYREQHFDCLACNVAMQHRAGIDIMVDGDVRLDDDVAGRSWVSYATERIEGIGAPRVEVPPAGFMADKGPGDLMWEVIETRMTPPVTGRIGKTTLQLDRAYKAIAP